MKLEFTRFTVDACSPRDVVTCRCDSVKIVEGDGRTLMDTRCGYDLPPVFTTETNTVDIFFNTDASRETTGWSLNWTAVTPGLMPLLTMYHQDQQHCQDNSSILNSCKFYDCLLQLWGQVQKLTKTTFGMIDSVFGTRNEVNCPS